jgi:hypothetical protein
MSIKYNARVAYCARVHVGGIYVFFRVFRVEASQRRYSVLMSNALEVIYVFLLFCRRNRFPSGNNVSIECYTYRWIGILTPVEL